MSKLDTLVARPSGRAVPLVPLTEETLPAWLAKQDKALATWVQTNDFKGQAGRFCLLPASDGAVQNVLIGLTGTGELWDFGALPSALPPGDYDLKGGGKTLADRAALGWALGSYRFTKYKEPLSLWPGWSGRTAPIAPRFEVRRRRSPWCVISSIRRPAIWDRRSWPVQPAHSPEHMVRARQ